MLKGQLQLEVDQHTMASIHFQASHAVLKSGKAFKTPFTLQPS